MTPGLLPSLFYLIFEVLWIIKWFIILDVVFSMLASFNVIDTRNRIVWGIGDFLHRVTAPILRPIRNVLPNFGGLDLSPWAAVLLLQFVAAPLVETLRRGVVDGYWSLV